MIRVGICDNDIHFTGILEKLLQREAAYNSINITIGVFFSVITLVEYMRKGHQFDIIYLDIFMTNENGIETASHIREIDRSILLIIISGYEQYLKELFELEPFRFLSKPLNPKKFSHYFQDACQRIGENNAYFQFKNKKEIRKVALRNVVYFESRSPVIHIYLMEKRNFFMAN